MTVDTEGFVATRFKDVLVVCTIVESTLTRLIGAKRRAEFPNQQFSAASREKFQVPTVTLTPGSGMVRFAFKCDGESRTLTLHLTADCDHCAYTPKSLAVSMGASGAAETYVRAVLHALSVFGPAWYDGNDCDGIDEAPLGLPRPTLMGLVGMGQVSPYDFENMRETLSHFFRGNERAYLDTVGCTEVQAHQFDAEAGTTERWDAMRAFAKTVYGMESAAPSVDQPAVKAARRMRA